MTGDPRRRTLLATLTACTAALAAAGCTKYGDEGAEPEPEPSAPDSTSTGEPGRKQPAGPPLTKTSDIPVGGGKVFKAEKVVVTQPEKGDFKAFSAVCTHAGCTVRDVTDGTINCPCHGSKYSATDAAVTAGPAPRPLPRREIEVKGDEIRLT